MKKLVTLFLSFLLIINVFGYTSLRVSDPRTSWMNEQATISEATYSVRPSGAFSEVSLYLTFSAQGTAWATKTDSLEIVLDFDLPQDAHVTDSWLWMGDEIVKALMLDRSQATQIYESIVKRRRDPSILYKNSPTQYQLRVFPMLGNASRKIKLTFLMPTKLETAKSVVEIPLNIIHSSRMLPSSIDCIAYDNATWHSPIIKQFTDISFAHVSDTEPLKGKKATINSLSGISFLGMEFSHSVNTSKYFTTYTQNGETYYQIMFDHTNAFGLEKPVKNTVFVLDYESPTETSPIKYPYTYTGYDYNSGNNTYTTQYDTSVFYKNNLYSFHAMKQALKNVLHQKFTENDNFNVAYSINDQAFKKSESWIHASSANINSHIGALDSTLAGKSSLVYSLPEAYSFIKAQGGGSIFLITNRHNYENITSSGSLLDKLQNINYKVDRIDLFDFSNVATPSSNNSNNYNYGYGINVNTTYNNKLYLLASHTKFYNQILGGCYSYYMKYRYSYDSYYLNRCYSNSDLTNTSIIFDNYFDKFTNFDYTAFINSGYNYNEHLLGLAGSTSIQPYGKLSLIGKYKGSLPFVLRLSAKYKGVQQYTTLTFNAADTIAASGLLRQFWAGHQINNLEKKCSYSNNYYDYYYGCTPDVETRLEIAKASLDNRVLSRYTAFFAPEIGFNNVEACTTCVDETGDNFPVMLLNDGFGKPSFVNSPQTMATGIDADSLFNAMEISVYPNPANEKATISMKKPYNIAANAIKIEIFNLQGTLIEILDTAEMKGNALQYEWKLTDNDGNRISKGLYIIAINIKGVRRFKKLIVE